MRTHEIVSWSKDKNSSPPLRFCILTFNDFDHERMRKETNDLSLQEISNNFLKRYGFIRFLRDKEMWPQNVFDDLQEESINCTPMPDVVMLGKKPRKDVLADTYIFRKFSFLQNDGSDRSELVFDVRKFRKIEPEIILPQDLGNTTVQELIGLTGTSLLPKSRTPNMGDTRSLFGMENGEKKFNPCEPTPNTEVDKILLELEVLNPKAFE